MVASILFVVFYAMTEWVLGKLSPRRMMFSVCTRLVVLVAGASILFYSGLEAMMPFVAAGLWFRNSPFGIVHGFRLSVPQCSVPASSNARPAHVVNVTVHGIMPDTGVDVLDQVQALIDEVGQQGGGCIFFPKGRYLFNLSGKAFLQINHSHITIEGECDAEGHLLTELVNCGPTTRGERNPWLSPFFITTGEALQHSNMFWGLQFRKPSGMRTESSSLSDPGSDGTILTPPFATRVTGDAFAGSSILSVEDSSVIGQYILLGMYNTTPDGPLLKELLGVDALRPEWTTAHRAGPEEAPSFQWLVEVKRVVDRHTIELCRPLLRDCLMKYEPAIFNVDMLEDIHIRRLRISSRWNGLFHHHGLPLYYSVAQAQEMDYGWNAINMKRVAHATVEGVEICDFTNPLYVQDSREVTVQHVAVKGYDGHQGIKVYCHTCDCLFQHIDFYCHFADMMGGEGNAYSNVFRDICYRNPRFKPVDFDFHGFSEGPMSPPAYNLFEWVQGFRYIKGAGAVFMQPACGIGNVWRDVAFEGGKKGDSPFFALSYRVKSGLEKYVTAAGYTIVMMMKRKRHTLAFAQQTFKDKLKSIDQMSIPREQHAQFFPGCRVG
ncbi:MAG: hypothetical protein IJR87_09340 [Bacteroidaceae bacterium]|nr:hypothetical protein [Bacteroidaceae bacterium]